MEIKIELDEATIIRKAMEGLSKEGIEKWAADVAIGKAKTKVLEIIEEKVFKVVNELHIDKIADNSIRESIKNDCLKFMTPEHLKRQFKKEDWTRLFEDSVAPVLTTFIEYALDDWLSIGITVGSGKQKKTFSVAGVNSYTHRKK